ncbi:MAG: RsmB/NOP family class I SAM-dependent RNA methyltransferase [Natronomonas sp.]
MNPLSRYEDVVDDAEAFYAACERSLSSVVRVNRIKATPERVRQAFDEADVSYERADWHDGLFRLGEEVAPGNTWPYVHGWVHGQEEVSAVPPVVLDPQPGERVFDACSAPGSKTTQLASMMDDHGVLVGNDNNLGRLSALRSNAERCGVTNLVVTRSDARNFSLKPFDGELFDRALADVPCSCEGTIRKNPDVLDEWSSSRIEGLSEVQGGILKRAIEMTKPGGTVVYSTCTFAPEENEAVLQSVLESHECLLVPYDLDLTAEPGLTEWQDEIFDESMRHAKRIYPHHNDTGGFFCAKLEVGA